MDFSRASKRIYRHSELGLWLRRVSCDWEKPFRQEELELGRMLYKDCAIRTLELNSTEAIICARMEDGSEPYCVIDFEEDKFIYRGSDESSLLTAALSVAGMYEISELVGDVLASPEFIDYQTDTYASFTQNDSENYHNKTSNVSSSDSKNEAVAREEKTTPSNKRFRKLALSFTSRRRGLSFTVAWESESGKPRKAFGEHCVPIEELTLDERSDLIRLASLARKAGFKYESGAYLLADISKVLSFFTNLLPKWKAHFTIHKDKQVELLKLGERKLELRPTAKIVEGENADFDVEWKPCVGDELIDPTEMSKLFGGIGTLRIIPQYGIVRISNQDTSFVKEVERSREFGFSDGKIPRYMLLALSDFGNKMALSPELHKWMTSIMKPLTGESDIIPDFLRRYQRKGVEWAKRLFSHNCNAMIADEMGLGKTLQTLTLIDIYLKKGKDEKKKFLVVCPASVIPVWNSETKKFFPHIKTSVLSSKGIDTDAQLWISSYTQLRRNKAQVEKIKFELAVLDEAQFIKNPDAKTTIACMGINSAKKIALTGTPVENRLLDMWTAFKWLMPGLMGTRKAFEETINTDPDAVSKIRKQIAPFVLRRLKAEVASELPEKIYVDLVCPMTEQQTSEYQKLLLQAKEELKIAAKEHGRITILSLLTRLRQAACDASLLPWIADDDTAELGGKVSILIDKVEELYLSGKKVLIFSQFTKFLELIRKHLSKRIGGENLYWLTGTTRDRAQPVAEFQNTKKSAVMLISLRAGGTGITLTSADYVFIADPWWNPAVEEQAIDRVHRIGRKGDVFVYRMVSQGTVEDRVRILQSKKRKLFNDLLGGLKDVSNSTKFIETISDILQTDSL